MATTRSCSTTDVVKSTYVSLVVLHQSFSNHTQSSFLTPPQIVNFYVNDYGKLYRSCGNCDSQCARTVNINGVIAVNGGELAGINKAYGDKATLSNNCADTDTQCVLYDGCSGDCEASKVGTC